MFLSSYKVLNKNRNSTHVSMDHVHLKFDTSALRLRTNAKKQRFSSVLDWDSSLEWQMSDASRQTDIWINQYPCRWIKSNSSSHVLRRLQPAAHFVRGSSADPWASCPDANQGGGTNSLLHNSIRHLHIEHLQPMKICQYLPSLPQLLPHPTPTRVAPLDLRGILCPCPLLSPPHLPSWPCQAWLQYLTPPQRRAEWSSR